MTGFTTRALSGSGGDDLGPARPVSIPIHQTSTFAFDDAAELAELIRAGKDTGYVYTRWHNPTRAALEEAVAEVEGGDRAVSFSSGMSAIVTTLAALAKTGDHVVFSSDLYGGTFSTATKILPRWGIDVTVADSHRTHDIANALRENTVACFVETIGNPRCSVTDLESVAAECAQRGVRLVVDNTFASPYLCRPLELGAAVVMESSTKYLGGHHDLIGGVIATDAATARDVREMAIDLGGTAPPFDSWLTLRGIATLALRMDRTCATALRLASLLEAHAAVSGVWYPGLPSHPDHATALKQLPRGSGGMLAVELSGGLEAGRRFCESLRVGRMAASLGGVHTLVIHPASVTHTQLSADEREAVGITDGLVRISVGIEDAEDLLDDVEQALA